MASLGKFLPVDAIFFRGRIRRVFIAQGALIGVIGTAIGLVLGYAIYPSWSAARILTAEALRYE